MAIQMRRGQFQRFQPSKLLAGEWAVVVSGDTASDDGRAVYVCFAAGTVKRMATYEDMVANILSAESDIVERLTAGTEAATRRADTATANANAATTKSESATADCVAVTKDCRSATSACVTATKESATQTAAAEEATGRANSAADEAEAFLNGFVVEYDNLSDECKALIAQAAGSGASVISDEQGVAIIDALADVIASGREAGTLTDEQGMDIIDRIFG